MGIIVSDKSIDALELNRKQEEYVEYIKNHVANVNKVYTEIILPLANDQDIMFNTISTEEFRKAVIDVKSDIEEHDASKYSEEEFEDYRSKYFQTSTEKYADEETKKILTAKAEEAWEHHYTTNDHHPMFWKDSKTGAPIDMSLRAIIHMICDWEAMSLNFGTDTLEWWKKAEKERKAMTDATINIVEELLSVICKK